MPTEPLIPPLPSDTSAAMAVMSHQIGQLQHAIESANRENSRWRDDHEKRIGVLEEAQIRADEREKTEDRLRKILAQQQAEAQEQNHARVTFTLSRWQMVFGAVAALAAVGYLIVLLVQLSH